MTNTKKHRLRSFERFLYLDLLADKRARPIFIYVVVAIVVASLFYHWLEGWSLLDSFYFVIVSFTTIGYGDLVPTRPFTKFLTIILALNGVAILLMLFDEIQRVRRRELNERLAEEAGDASGD